MFIAHTVGRPIPEEKQAKHPMSFPRLFPYILAALDLVAIGVLVGLILGNQMLLSQRSVYGEANMAAASVVLDLMDDFLKPLVFAMSTVLLLTALTLGAWLLAGIRTPLLRWAAVTLLVFLLAAGAVWFGLGRRTTAEGPLRPVTPTPVVQALGP